MIKIRVLEEGKQFEAFLKFAILEDDILVGAAYANNFTSVRAVHAAMYEKHPIELVYEDGRIRKIITSRDFRRIETIDDIITHHTLLPRSTNDDDYQELLIDKVKYNKEEYPARIVLAPLGNAKEVAGHFLAETFGLPRSKEWVNQYVNLLLDKCKRLEVIVDDLAGEWKELKAFKIMPLKEEYVLQVINDAIQKGVLQVRSASVFGDGTFAEDMTTEEYLRQNVSIIAKKIDATMKPLTDGSKIAPSVGELIRTPVPVQAKSSMAALEVLKRKKGVFIVGDMGTGKTITSLTSAYVYHKERIQSGAQNGTRVLIIAPSNVVPKWAKKEIPKTLPKGSYKIQIISTTEDALKYVNEVKHGKVVPKNQIEFILISTDRMKLGPQGWVLGAKWDSKYAVWRSPNTGKPLLNPRATKQEKEDIDAAVAGWSDVVSLPKLPPGEEEITEAKKLGTLLPNGLPKGYVKSWKLTVRNFQDDYKTKVDRSLARPALKEWGESSGKARWMIAQIFQHHLKNHFHLGILDEIHQMKASGSGRGLALHKILKACRSVIMLTGTLTNGASTSIKSLLWRVFPKEMIAQGINYNTSEEQFAQRYGVVEKVKTIDDGNSITGTYTKQKKDNTIVKEKPGISPKLVADFLLDKCIFVELSDLGIPLVKLQEIPKIIKLDEDHYDEYKKLHSHLYDASLRHQQKLGTAAWSKFNPTTLNYADQPHLGANVKYEYYDKHGDYCLLEEVKAPTFPKNYITIKEKEVIKDIKKELLENRHCIIFTHFTGEYKTNERWKELLISEGITCEIMNERVGTAERVDWLEKQSQAGTEVLITNQRLVEVGLDLMDFPTIMFVQMNDDINVVRQASRRAWRLGQHRNCKVFYYVCEKTSQMNQFERLMSRRVAAMIVEGRIERSDDLAKYADTSTNGSVSDLSKTLSSVELTNAWVSAAEKDIDSDLEIVSEEEFQSKVQEAFERLTKETIKLSGYQPPINAEDKALCSSDFDMKAFELALEEMRLVEAAYESLKQSQMPKQVVTEDQLAEKRKKQNAINENVQTEQLDFYSFLA